MDAQLLVAFLLGNSLLGIISAGRVWAFGVFFSHEPRLGPLLANLKIGREPSLGSLGP